MAELLAMPTLPEAFTAAGLPYPGDPEPGKLSRFSTRPNRRDDRSGWLRMFPDGQGAAFGCWREGATFTWQRRDENAPPPTKDERATIRAKSEAARAEAEAERDRDYQAAAELAGAEWKASRSLKPGFDYLTAKGIKPHIARLSGDGRMMVPVRGPDGEIQSLQYIAADGAKRFMPGGKMTGGWCVIGTVRPDLPVLLAEGFATAASLHETTGYPVFCCFTAGNIGTVAAMLKDRYPDQACLICGDEDRATAGNPGRTKATAAAEATGARLAFPLFKGEAGSDFNDMTKEAGPDAVRNVIEAALKPTPSRFRLLSAADLSNLPPHRWRIRGVLPQAGIGAVFGPSGSGKSFLVIDMLAAVATGRTWFDCRVKRAPVLYIALEGEAGITQRVQAHQIRHGDLPPGFRFLLTPLDIRKADDRAELVKAARAAGLADGVLVLDTLNRAAPGMDENDSSDMGEVIAAAKALQAELGGLALLVHHTGKDAAKGLRGHSSLHAALDCAIEVRRDGDRREWSIAKAKDGDDGEAHPFRLDVVEVGEDDDGEPVTSCIVMADEAAHVATRPKLPKGGNQRIVWDALGGLLKTSGHFGMAGAPPTRPCLELEAAIEAIAPRLTCEERRKVTRAREAFTGLLANKSIEHREGWVWLP